MYDICLDRHRATHGVIITLDSGDRDERSIMPVLCHHDSSSTSGILDFPRVVSVSCCFAPCYYEVYTARRVGFIDNCVVTPAF